jgi:1-pyrroline-4-hydroxy-2-carboxylate deaminase
MVERFTGRGVWPASTTPFDGRGRIDYRRLAVHLRWLVREGCEGVVVLGSLGEGSTLSPAEKTRVVRTAAAAMNRRGAVLAAVASARTSEAVELARTFARAGAGGLMVLPQYVYRGDDSENEAHVAAVIEATELPCLLYNNPVAYGVDFRPEQVRRLARRHPNLVAVKESSGDARRFARLRRILPRGRAVMVGIDDQVLVGARAGAVGWVAGLANAWPSESVALWRLARDGPARRAEELFRWFVPLLALDAEPKFVQLIKAVEAETGVGNGRLRPPRWPVRDREMARVRKLVRAAQASRPTWLADPT